jgi:hypothetical protein
MLIQEFPQYWNPEWQGWLLLDQSIIHNKMIWRTIESLCNQQRYVLRQIRRHWLQLAVIKLPIPRYRSTIDHYLFIDDWKWNVTRMTSYCAVLFAKCHHCWQSLIETIDFGFKTSVWRSRNDLSALTSNDEVGLKANKENSKTDLYYFARASDWEIHVSETALYGEGLHPKWRRVGTRVITRDNTHEIRKQ